ncbi:threonylcarbamoyl-AMP synthase [Candidatus Parcubacteria bacterium]|nr:threonylcarbamoyl-AMP synthase [Candidatus Parcubacteria bacterium]
MEKFAEKVLEIVKKIKKGSFLSYKEIAKMAGNERAARLVGNILAQNKDPSIPCHRVIKSNNEIGGYKGSLKNSWEKAAILLKEGAIGVLPTDTIYGILGSARNKNVVEKIYKLKKRNPKKPSIILISSLNDLKEFKIKLKKWQKIFLEKIIPSKISFILPCSQKEYFYLHRGTNTLAFRVPNDKRVLKLLQISGPLIAPSANFEGKKPAETISEAKKYFKNKVFYLNGGRLKNLPSTLIDLTQKEIKIIRKGGDFQKLKKIFSK